MKLVTTMKKALSGLLVAAMLFTMPAITTINAKAYDDSPVADVTSKDIVILYDNDVHCAVDGYSNMAALKKEALGQTKNVATVSCGDFIQGGVLGTLSKGDAIIDIMNEVGYDVVTLGNHEFDYTIPQLKKLVKKFKGKTVSCNFRTVSKNKPVFKGYTTKKFGKTKIAFVGVTTPEAFTKSTPVYFQNKDGKFIYSLCQDSTGKKLYDRVQKNVDLARKNGADYVIAVTHLGMEGTTEMWNAEEVVKNTKGIDVLLDGHSHEVYASEIIKNKAGKDVIVSQSGSKFANIGKVVIKADGTISSSLVNVKEYGKTDETTTGVIAALNAMFEEVLNQVIGKNEQLLTVNGADGKRAIRKAETNLGDFCADAYREVLGADIALINGGGIRADLPEGDITRKSLITVFPFGNMGCTIKATGQQILDALEMGARKCPEENGGFLQVSGMKYTIDTSIASNVKLDEEGLFVSVEGEYRVKDVMIYNKETKEYEALDLAKKYEVAGVNYTLRNQGDGMAMFKGCEVVKDDTMEDCQVLIEYVQALNGVIGAKYAEAAGRIIVK